MTTSLPAGSIPIEELASPSSLLAFRGTTISKCTPVPPPDATTFAEYISSLPLWDKRLLSAIDLVDPEGLLAHLRSEDILLLVSDGGADNDLGSFGLLIASDESTFTTVSNTTEGILPGSYRAESYGCLAILQFLYHFMHYHTVNSPKILNKFYCDNLSLITRLKQAA
jgi:hypothetical protein